MGETIARSRGFNWLRPLGVIAVIGVVGVVQSCSKPPPEPHLAPLPSIVTPVTPTAPPPSPPGIPAAPAMANLAVQHHCFCTGPRDQFQTKLQLSVTNTSSVPLNASIGNIRILVAGDMPGQWTPKDPTATPSNVTVGGRRYVAIPANGNKAWEPEYATFASHCRFMDNRDYPRYPAESWSWGSG
jgi:hypothetical protein